MGIVVNHYEIGERGAPKERLPKEHELLGALLDIMEVGVVVCDADGVLTLFNEATRRFHGRPQKALAAEEWADHYDLYRPGETTPMPMEEVPLFRALSGEVVRDAGVVIATEEGAKRFMRVNGRPIIGDDGTKLGAVVAMQGAKVMAVSLEGASLIAGQEGSRR